MLERMTEKVLIVIPAFNPPQSLSSLVRTLVDAGNFSLIVVNDGSAKRFLPLFASISNYSQVTVITNATNLGKGAALRVGINQSLLQSPNLSGIVTADADGQHSAKDIIAISGFAETQPDHFGLGYREFNNKVPIRSRLGNQLSRVLYRILLGLKLKDTQTGLRYLPRSFAIHCLTLESNGYEFETEQLIQSASLEVPIAQLPIQTIYLNSGKGSHFSPFFDSLRIYFLIIRYALSSVATTTVDFIVFAISVHLGAGIVVANLIGRSLALFVQYILLGSFVFRKSGGITRFFFFVIYVMVVGLISGLLQVWLPLASIMGPFGAKIIIEACIYIFNFLFLRDILFGTRKSSTSGS